LDLQAIVSLLTNLVILKVAHHIYQTFMCITNNLENISAGFDWNSWHAAKKIGTLARQKMLYMRMGHVRLCLIRAEASSESEGANYEGVRR
jgi:hypothetical protein